MASGRPPPLERDASSPGEPLIDNGAHYENVLYDSPSPSSASDVDSDSGASMQQQYLTPEGDSRSKPGSPGAAAAANLGRLSLDQTDSDQRGRHHPYHSRSHGKRSASRELERPAGRRSPPGPYVARIGATARPQLSMHATLKAHQANRRQKSASQPLNGPKPLDDEKFAAPFRVDSGYESRRTDTLQSDKLSWAEVAAPLPRPLEHDPRKQTVSWLKEKPSLPAPRSRYPGLILQPESAPITQEQLAAEVKGIYAGLVMVEAKCINIDAQQAADPKAELGPDQWRALIALHRTLLYEHHDFLMATQHPSANPALKSLAAKYCMPARMWKHGIHAFLEVLRHRRPRSQEYMMTFIYLAYQMMALLFETVPSFLDTWIECLGDLARYRMAIEEDKEVHATWGAVAGRWYTMAADRHAQIGRLYHHLGILERPSLRKFYFYARSLTAVVPFTNAKESLATLCAPILQDEQAVRSGSHSAEAMTICFLARDFSRQSQDLIERDGRGALSLLAQQTSGKLASYGVALAVTSIAALFEYGAPHNIFRTMYADALARDAHNARPSVHVAECMSEAAKAVTDSAICFDDTTSPSDFVISFFATCFNTIIRRELDQATIRDLMQFVHVNLVWLSSLLDLRAQLSVPSQIALVDRLLSSIAWADLAIFLNALAQIDPISSRVVELAAGGIFPVPERRVDRRPLAEDYQIRGIVWAEWYFPSTWFQWMEDDDGSRGLETAGRLHLRAERVEWQACCVANKRSGLVYDRVSGRFSASPAFRARGPEQLSNTVVKQEQPSESTRVWPRAVLASPSTHSSIGGDFEMVSAPSDTVSLSSKVESHAAASPLPKTWASVVSGDSAAAVRGTPERKFKPASKGTLAQIKIENGSDEEKKSLAVF